ncbi:MAG: hypothetical protein M1831_006981 [Alyxoria varia]|nr:MAG: hypothetical protein M1831_006981 [Alyxoria varia]
MSLIIICGHPSSGKTYRARQLVDDFQARLRDASASTTSSIDTADANDSTTSSIDNADADVTSTSRVSGLSQNDDGQGLGIDRSISTSTTIPSTSASASSSSQNAAPTPPKPARKPQTKPPPINTITYISDHTLSIPRSSYAHTHTTEKTTRSTLYTAVKRALSRRAVVILDSGNYVKGWRYQLHCEGKAVGVRSCVVHIGVNEDRAREVNNERLERAQHAHEEGSANITPSNEHPNNNNNNNDNNNAESQPPQAGGPNLHDPYDPTVHTDLLSRFEEPNPLHRWDSPLYVTPWSDATPPCAQIWEEVVLGIGRDGRALSQVKPNAATVLTPATNPNQLYAVDRVTQQIVTLIQAHQRHSEDPGGTVDVPLGPGQGNGNLQLELPALSSSLSTPHLQRLRRQFIALQRQQVGGAGAGAVGRVGPAGGGGSVADGRTAARNEGVMDCDKAGNGANRGKKGMSDQERKIARLFVDWLGDVFERGL